MTRSTEPVAVERRGKLAGLRRPRNISLVFDVFICILLLAVHKRRGVKRDDILLTAQDGGISSDRVVSSTFLCTSHGSWRSSIKAMKYE